MHALISILIASFCLVAQESSAPESLFDQGLKAYHAKQYDKARENFEKALEEKPNDAAILYNLGLAYYQQNKKGYAVGLWRKALSMSPGLHAASAALERVEDRFHFSHLEKTPWEQTLHSAYQHFGWNFWLLGLAAVSAFVGWQWLNFFQRRKDAAKDESTEAPTIGAFLTGLSLLWLMAVGLNAGKLSDELSPRGTVVSSSAELKAAPSNDGVALANVPEASELAIRGSHDDWLQVTTSDGATGWLQKSDVLPVGKEH